MYVYVSSVDRAKHYNVWFIYATLYMHQSYEFEFLI